MSTQKVYPVYSFQYIQNKLVELSRQKLNSSDVTPQVQADWIETDTFSPAYIKNKPTIPAVIGDVVGPSSAVSGNIVLFDGTTGKLIKDSGNNLSQFQYNISLTTTGSSGSATFVSNVLNIPTPTLAGLGGITLSSLSASSPLSYNNTTGAFSIQVASSTQNGYLSSTDWNTFNNKQSALGFTAVPTTRTLTINGTAYDLSADRSWTISSGGMTNPMTTAGDIIYGGASGTPTRLGIGTSGYVLQAGASAPAWFDLFGTANTWTGRQTFYNSAGLLFSYNGASTNIHMTSYINTNANGNFVAWVSNNSANTVTYSALRQLLAGSGNGFGMISLAVNQAATGTTLTPYLTADGQYQTVATFVKTIIGATASTNGILSSAAKSMLDVIGCIGTAVVAKTSTYTTTITDSTILCNATTGAITINLPTTSGISGRFYTIKKTDSSANAITIDANGTQTIDGALTYTLSTQNKYVTIQTDGTNWYVVANN